MPYLLLFSQPGFAFVDANLNLKTCTEMNQNFQPLIIQKDWINCNGLFWKKGKQPINMKKRPKITQINTIHSLVNVE